MARYKEYNEKRVTEIAMQQFWSQGYNATSLTTLTEAMNINKFTFYDVFASKEKLLIRTMRHYYDHYYMPCVHQLQKDLDIPSYFLRLFSQKKDNLCGCYILSITSETGESIPEAVEILNKYINCLEEVTSGIVVHYKPDIPPNDLTLKVEQLLALLTAVPMMNSIKSSTECIAYAQNVLGRIELNN